MTLIFEPLVRSELVIPNWKAIMLLLSSMHLTTFDVIFLLTSEVFPGFQEKYVICHYSTPFNAILCF